MKAFVQLFVLLVICTLVTGNRLPENDPGSAMYDMDYPVDQEVDNDYGSARLVDTMYNLDFPFDGENDPGSA